MINAPITRVRFIPPTNAIGNIFTASKRCIVTITVTSGTAGAAYRNSVSINNLIYQFEIGPGTNVPRGGTVELLQGETIYNADTSQTIKLTVLELE